MSSSRALDELSIPGPLRVRAVRLARRYTRDQEDAEDVVQEALMRAWRNREALSARERLWPWLARIVANEAMRAYGRRRLELPMQAAEGLGSDDAALTGLAERIDLDRGLAGLDPASRELLRMRYELDLTQPVIAARLGLPEGTVKIRLHRARALLRRSLTK